MASFVLPQVRLLFPCDHAEIDPRDEKWVLKNPWPGTVLIPPGATFPFQAEEFWVYAQLSGGLGEFGLMIEMLRVEDDGSRRHIRRSSEFGLSFPAGSQLLAPDAAFHLLRVPFRREGLYEFRLVADIKETDEVAVPEGMVAQVRVLDARGAL
jgi:hypothetical protein